MSRVRGVLNVAGDVLMFWCPACECAHGVDGTWAFDGDYDRPTFSPSVLSEGGGRCHSYVRAGRIEFLSDCTHALAGTTVEMERWPYE